MVCRNSFDIQNNHNLVNSSIKSSLELKITMLRSPGESQSSHTLSIQNMLQNVNVKIAFFVFIWQGLGGMHFCD